MKKMYLLLCLAALSALLAVPRITAGAAALSRVPAFAVTPGERVQVFELDVEPYAGIDALIDADGATSPKSGRADIASGDRLYEITTSSRMYRDMQGTFLWHDRDRSGRFTAWDPFEQSRMREEETAVVKSGLYRDPDIDAPLTPLPATDTVLRENVLMASGHPRDLAHWDSAFDALFLDAGRLAGLADAGDIRIDSTILKSSYPQQAEVRILQTSDGGTPVFILKGTDRACPRGVAAGDTVLIDAQRIVATEVVHALHEPSGSCIARVFPDGGAKQLPYNIEKDAFGYAPYTGTPKITAIATEGDSPYAGSTRLRVTGDMRGIAAGDRLRLSGNSGQASITITAVNTKSGTLDVRVNTGALWNGSAQAELTLQADVEAKTTALLVPQPRASFIDENSDGRWSDGEPVYFDADQNAAVSAGDRRLSGVDSEVAVYQELVADNQADGFAMITDYSEGVPWMSQTPFWRPGDDIVVDRDGDGYYQMDTLTSLRVSNRGTAQKADIESVMLWRESNGTGGYQETDTLLAILSPSTVVQEWEVTQLGTALIGSGRLYITADTAHNARDGATMKFAMSAGDIVTMHRTLPSAVVENAHAQLIAHDEKKFRRAPNAAPAATDTSKLQATAVMLKSGDLFMIADDTAGGTVYLFDGGRKNPFPSQNIFLSWYRDFSVPMVMVPRAVAQKIPWGANVAYRPGSRLIKIPDDPRVYAPTADGSCVIPDEKTAAALYGPLWARRVDDVQASLFAGSYPTLGCALTANGGLPDGSIARFENSRYLVQGGVLRPVTDKGWLANAFKAEYEIALSTLAGYVRGAPLTANEFSLHVYRAALP